MKKYYHKHPRNFANECDVLVCSTPNECKLAESNDYKRITLKALKKHIAWINAENDSWGSNRAFGKMTMENIINNSALTLADLKDYARLGEQDC